MLTRTLIAYRDCLGCPSKLGLCADKQTFAKLDVVGWYCTGTQAAQQEMSIHQRVSCYFGCLSGLIEVFYLFQAIMHDAEYLYMHGKKAS